MGGASRLLMLVTTPSTLLYPRSAALRLARHHSRLSRHSISTAGTATAAHGHLPYPRPNPRPGFSVRAAEQVHTQAVIREDLGNYSGHPPRSGFSHPWPEWSKLVNHITAGGYHAGDGVDDSFVEYTDLPVGFVKEAKACLSFARVRPDLVRSLSRRDIEVVVENGSPFLFKNGDDSARRMSSLIGGENQVLESERAHTIDIMRYLLSYACNPLVTSDNNSIKATEHTEASVRNLLNELVNMSGIDTELTPRPPSLGREQFSRPPGKNIEMKRGDWVCSKCSFMNFARNIRCLECNEGRSKQQLTGGEWECPQCDFLNYGRNMACLRCDCKRPGGSPSSADVPRTNSGYGKNTNFEQILNGVTTDKSEIERRLAANDEKAERWFSKAAQLDDASDLSRAAADEDFPEIMPMRKGENRFVVSTRKTPLERRLASAQNNLGNGSVADQSNSQFGGVSRSDRTTDSAISKSLDRILGRSSSTSGANQQSAGSEINAGPGSELNSPDYSRSVANQRRDPGYVPFVPLPADMFSKSKVDSDTQQVVPRENFSAKASQQNDSVYKFSESPAERKIDKESSDASERWFTKVAELDDVTDLANAIPDEDFPEIMPMRKGENRFVVSKKKDRSLTSPQYKRRLAMEQANNSNFVPFVPFPPDYFAKKDTKPGAAPTITESSTGSSTPLEQVQGVTEKLAESKPVGTNAVNVGNIPQQPGNWTNSGNSREFYSQNTSASKVGSAYGGPATNSSQASNNMWNNSQDAWNSGALQRNNGNSGQASNGSNGIGVPSNSGQASNNTWNKSGDAWNSGNSQRNSASNGSNATRTLPPPPPPPTENLQSSRDSWKFSGKSLEGSAVKESDPLDMSEEAKAERWFRRVAQIKDISELSQIPDEDFPEIMPMRKGVNRFVVSKRKTPLERRLTSPQYRRNLPIVSSESEKDSRKE